MLPEGELAEQTAQTLAITQLPTWAPPPPRYAEQDLHELPPRWRARRKAALWSEEDKALGLLESISSSDSDTPSGCLTHLLPQYSCKSSGGRVTPQEALVETCCILQEPWQKGTFSTPTTHRQRDTFPVGKLCVPLWSDMGWEARDCLTFSPLTCSSGGKGHCWETSSTPHSPPGQNSFPPQKKHLPVTEPHCLCPGALLGAPEGPVHPSALLKSCLHNWQGTHPLRSLRFHLGLSQALSQLVSPAVASIYWLFLKQLIPVLSHTVNQRGVSGDGRRDDNVF